MSDYAGAGSDNGVQGRVSSEVLPLGPVVDAVLRGHGGVLASVPVRWVAVHVESSAPDLNDEGLSYFSRPLVRV